MVVYLTCDCIVGSIPMKKYLIEFVFRGQIKSGVKFHHTSLILMILYTFKTRQRTLYSNDRQIFK